MRLYPILVTILTGGQEISLNTNEARLLADALSDIGKDGRSIHVEDYGMLGVVKGPDMFGTGTVYRFVVIMTDYVRVFDLTYEQRSTLRAAIVGWLARSDDLSEEIDEEDLPF
jgi:hypothetical protein